MWAIWYSRNNITHDKNGYNPTHSITMIKDDLAILEVPLEHSRFVPGFGWKPPEYDWVKINTDDGIAGEVRKGGAGGITRSPTDFIAAWSKPYPGVTDPLVAEALAMRDRVIFAQLRGFS